MSAIVEGAVTTLAFCWRIERRDGVAIGLTSHDRDLTIGGIVHRAAPGIAPSAVVQGDGLDGDTMAVEGALSGAAIRADDLAAGRWDGARARLSLVDWTDPGSGEVVLATGEIGAVAATGGGFSAELASGGGMLDRPPCPQTSPECRAMLGDARCRVDMAPRRILARLAAPADGELIEIAGADARFAHGRLRWLGGANCGLESGIAAAGGGIVTLLDPPYAPAAAGTLVELSEGCDRSLATCRDRFANVANFRGEPHLPGMDLLTRYPGA